jgi:DNA polymerase-3 subunit epsilon
LVKTLLPAHNVALRRRENQVVMQFDARDQARFVRAREFELDGLGDAWGPFASRAAARAWLTHLAREHGLCLKALGAEGRRAAAEDGAPCFNRQLNRCRGACVGAELPAEHATRLRSAVAPWVLPAWPCNGPVALVERDAARFREDWHVFDRWCWLGSVRTLDAALGLARQRVPCFEADTARLAMRALAADGRWALERVELGAL